MKNHGKVILAVFCAVILFASGFMYGAVKNITVNAGTVAQTVVPSVNTQTTVPTTSAPAPQTEASTQAPETQEQDTTTTSAPEESTAPSQEPSATSSSDIAAKVNEAVNALKNEQNFKAEKTEKTVINITDCSASSLTNMLNSICQKVAGEKTSTYDFSNGQAVGISSDGKELNDGNPVSPKDAIPPKKADFKLNETGIKEATAQQNGDSTTYTIKLISEESTIDTAPQNNADALGYLNLGGFNIPTVTITQADVKYPESIIIVTVNGDGKVTEFKYEQPMEGVMGMKITLVSGSADFDGGNYESWKFSY